MKRRLSKEDKSRFIQLRRSFKFPVIGITGNVGKTTTLEIINTVLQKKGNVLKNKQAYGDWKHNLELLDKLSPNYDYALFEFDFKRGNNFDEILRLIKPNIGILTNIGDAHLSYLGSMLKIALQKSALIKYLARNGIAILNKDEEISSTIAQNITTQSTLRFGLSNNADFHASDIEHLGPKGTRFLLNGKYKVTLALFSISDIYNFLAATATLVALDIAIEEIVDIFQSDFYLPHGRGRVWSLNGHHIIDETYSSTPRSVAKAARTLVGFRPYVKNLVLIVGDMIESGPNIEEIHLNMGYFISALPIDYVVTVGNYAKYIGQGVSLIHSGKKVMTCNTIADIINIIDDVVSDTAAISIQGLGKVGMRRIIKHLSAKVG